MAQLDDKPHYLHLVVNYLAYTIPELVGKLLRITKFTNTNRGFYKNHFTSKKNRKR